jgi:hypothetical protein
MNRLSRIETFVSVAQVNSFSKAAYRLQSQLWVNTGCFLPSKLTPATRHKADIPSRTLHRLLGAVFMPSWAGGKCNPKVTERVQTAPY